MTEIKDISVSVRLLSWDLKATQPHADSTAIIAGRERHISAISTRTGTGASSGAELLLREEGRTSKAAPFIDVEFTLCPSEADFPGLTRLKAYGSVPQAVTGTLVDLYA